MADRLKILRITKRIHLFTSIVIVVFGLLFLVTGFVMTRHDWFPIGEMEKQSVTYPLATKIDTSKLERYGENLKREFGFSGRMNFQLQKSGAINYNFNHPGEGINVWIPASRDSLYITTSTQNHFGGVARQMHHLHGFKGGLLYVIWAILLDLTAVSFIVFSLTGMIIWLMNRKFLPYGWPVLLGSLAIFAAVFFTLLFI